MVTAHVNFIFESRLANIKDVLPIVLGCVKNKYPYITETDLFDIRLTLSELLVNTIIHGNKEDGISKNMELSVELGQDEIVTVIKDESGKFDLQKMHEYDGSIEYLLLGEYGTGLKLAGTLTDYLSFDTSNREITFRKTLTTVD